MLLIGLGIATISYTAIPKYNSIYLNKNKVAPKLVNTYSGEYISVAEILSKFLTDYIRIDKYTITNSGKSIHLFPSAIFAKAISKADTNILQLSKPIIRLPLGNSDEIYIAIEDFPTILNHFNMCDAKVFNNDLIINQIARKIVNLDSRQTEYTFFPAEHSPVVQPRMSEVPNNEETQSDSKATPNDPKSENLIPNSYQIPDKLIRRNIK